MTSPAPVFDGQKLKAVRLEQGGDKAKREHGCVVLDVSYATFENWETGKSAPNATNLFKLADYYGVTAETFMSRPTGRKR